MRASTSYSSDKRDGEPAVLCYTLRTAQRDAIEKELESSVTGNSAPDAAQKQELVRRIGQTIRAHCPDVLELLKHLDRARGSVAVVVDGLPVRGRDDLEKAVILKLALAGLCGVPFGYLQQNQGALVTLLQPTLGYEDTQTGISRNDFKHHTDDGILPSAYRCRYISLLGLVNEAETPTGLSPIDDMIGYLSPHSLKVLTEDRFTFRSSANYPFHYNYAKSLPRNVLTKNPMNGDWEVAFSGSTQPADADDTEAQYALWDLQRAADAAYVPVVIGSGVWTIFRNDRLMHNRSRVVGDRLVLRTYVRPDLAALRRATGSDGPIFDARMLLME